MKSFFFRIRFLFVPFSLFLLSFPISAQKKIAQLDSVYEIIKLKKIYDLPISDRITEIGKLFLGKPYQAFMLEGEKEELKYNFDKFDCVIFDELVISLAKIDSDTNYRKQFENQLIQLRYRNSEISYQNRNHYFTDWMKQTKKNKILEILKPEGIAVQSDKVINFMSTHLKSYAKLADSTLYTAIQKREAELTSEKFWYLPSEKLNDWIPLLKNGDVICFVTKIEGLDIAHVGLVIFQENKPYLLNAPRPGIPVRINDKELTDTLTKNPGYIGVIVGRLKDGQ